MRNRFVVLAMSMVVAVTLVACGRASQGDIDQALGLNQPVSTNLSGTPGASAADITLGKQQFTINCQQCHRPNGSGKGPALWGPGTTFADLSDDEIATIIRTGKEAHGGAPAKSPTLLSDKQLAAIIAYLRTENAKADAASG